MAQNGFSDRSGAKHDAGTSGERRDASEEPFWVTEGRALLRRGVVAHLYRYPISLCGVRLAMTQNHPGQMILFNPEML